MIYTVDMVYTVDTGDTVDTIDTVNVVYNFLTALHCFNSSWAGGTHLAEISIIGHVVDRVEEADWADGADWGGD